MRRVLRCLVEEVVAVSQVMFGAGGRRGERGRNAFRMVHLEGAIDFIGRNVVEALAFVLFGEAFPVELRGLEQRKSSHHVRLREGERVLDGAVHMAFCREVDDTVDMLILHELVESVEVADVHLHELVVRLPFDVLEIRKVARVGKLIEVDNPVFRVLVHEQTNDMASDKACAAGNDDILHRNSLQFKCEAQILKGRVLCVFLGKERFEAVAHRPLDANRGVVPHQTAFVLRVIKASALVHESCRFAEHHETMRKAFGNVELLLVLGRERDALPLTKSRASLVQIHRHVKNFALDDAHELTLRIFLLEMESAEHALLAARFVVLHKDHVEASGVELSLVVGFHKIAALVAKDRRFDNRHTLDGRLDEIKLSHDTILLFLLST